MCFDEAYQRMCKDGLNEDAGDLKLATVHWLRHTGISEDVKSRPREHVRDDAGHASMEPRTDTLRAIDENAIIPGETSALRNCSVATHFVLSPTYRANFGKNPTHKTNRNIQLEAKVSSSRPYIVTDPNQTLILPFYRGLATKTFVSSDCPIGRT